MAGWYNLSLKTDRGIRCQPPILLDFRERIMQASLAKDGSQQESTRAITDRYIDVELVARAKSVKRKRLSNP
jgi:hypothetical protein